MPAQVIDGKAVAAEVRARVAREVEELTADSGRAPGLATVLVGDDPASHVYVGNKRKSTEEIGMRSIHHGLDASTSQDALLGLIGELNADDGVDGILVQIPLPDQIDQDAVISLIDPGKDVDGLTAGSAGRLAQGRPGLVPCTPQGVMKLLAHAGVEPRGAEAVVIGRSILVGRPVASLLLNADATVTVCHSRTEDLPARCREADILIAAVGSP
ncbi:MAG: bifunctional 5,10-methylenetetrahydrofolate dehydrogenase/5,10-methenyltetrahydrofolate cyclohydrolase, partial [Solirubrobacterales bacterium]